jgi:Secretion system C-terminal sorting domain
MNRFNIFCSIILLMNNLFINAANFVDTSLVSGNVKYKLLISVPDDYSSSQKYSLIVALQPCLGDAKSYRNGFKDVSDSLKMIVVCPNVNQNWIADNQWGIITASIDSAKAIYNIDTTSIFLTGMSCNGDYALRNGLKNLYPFKGIFPWAPYTLSADPKTINFNSKMPITLAIGTKDEYAYVPVLNIFDSLKTHGAKVNLVLAPGIHHIYDFSNFGNVMINSIRYLIDTNAISIKYTGVNLPNFEMLNTDPGKQLVFKVANKNNKELIITSLSSDTAVIANLTILYTPSDSTVKFTIATDIGDKPGKSGQAVIILEAREKNGLAIEQVTFKVKVTESVNIENINNSGLFEIYPNPASDVLNVKNIKPGSTIQIFDITGNQILSKVVCSSIEVFNLTNFSKGIYLIKVTGKNSIETMKLIVK